MSFQPDWAKFGKWMGLCSALVLLALALNITEPPFGILLRIWAGFLGLYALLVVFRCR